MFDGNTYESKKDFQRLTAQLGKVSNALMSAKWLTLAELEQLLHEPQASISARIRDLRKPKFGGLLIDRRRRSEGTFEYRLDMKCK